MKNKKFILIVVLLLILNVYNFVTKFDYEKDESTTGYTKINLKRAKQIMGENVSLSDYERQFPPLFSFILIPVVVFEIEIIFYEVFIFLLFSILTYIVLYFFIKRYTDKNIFLIIFMAIAFNHLYCISCFDYVGGITYISTFLITLFLYFFIDINGKKRNIVFCGLLFCFIISIQFVFLYMIPFIILWLYFNNKSLFLKRIIMFIPSVLIFVLILLFQMLKYGFSIKGAIGGYSTYLTTQPLGLKMEILADKFFSIFLNVNVSIVIMYYLIFILIILYLDKTSNMIRLRKDIVFLKLLVFNFFVFLCIPCFAWGFDFLIYRYLLYFTPMIISISFIVVFGEK